MNAQCIAHRGSSDTGRWWRSIHGMQHALQPLPPSPAAADPESFFATLEILAAPGKGQRRVPKSEPLQVGRAEGRLRCLAAGCRLAGRSGIGCGLCPIPAPAPLASSHLPTPGKPAFLRHATNLPSTLETVFFHPNAQCIIRHIVCRYPPMAFTIHLQNRRL